MKAYIEAVEVVCDIRGFQEDMVVYADLCNRISKLKIKIAGVPEYKVDLRARLQKRLNKRIKQRVRLFNNMHDDFLSTIERYHESCK